MSETSFFINNCPSCGGCIEFPAHGIGVEIPCPHCQATFTLAFPDGQQDDPAQQLNAFLKSVAFPTEQRELLELSLFSCPAESSVLTKPHLGSASNETEARKVVDQFIAGGFLEEVSSDVSALLQTESSATLKALTKERKLPSSGTKETLAKRLAKAEPEGMQARFAGRRFFVCTLKGNLVVKKWRDADRYKKGLAENDCLRALEEGRLKDACLAVAKYEATRLIPRGSGIDWNHYDASPDTEVLQTIFTAQISRQIGFGVDLMSRIRVAAAIIQLWGTNNPRAWLPEHLGEDHLDLDIECRMLLFHALHQRRLASMRSVGMTRVEIVGSGWPDDCRICSSDAGKTYPIDNTPNLPHEGCTCEMGCRCIALGMELDLDAE